MSNINSNKNRLSEEKIIEILKFIYGDNTHHVIFYYPLDVDDVINAINKEVGINENTSIATCMDLLFEVNLRHDVWYHTWRYQYFTGDSNSKTTFTEWDSLKTLDELVYFIKNKLVSYTSLVNTVDNNLTESEQNIPQPENIIELIDTFNQYLDSDECKQELEKLNNNNNINTTMNNNNEQNVKYKFENIPVGTTVHIKDLDWYNNNKTRDIGESVEYVNLDRFNFVEDMSQYCGMIAKVVDINFDWKLFTLDIDNGLYSWTEEMFDVIAFPEIETFSESMYSNESSTIKNINNEPYEMVNHPSHYNSSSVETIEKMIRIWGYEKTAIWCEMTAFKYRDRIGNKPGNSLEQEMGKIKWYEAKADELYNKMKSDR